MPTPSTEWGLGSGWCCPRHLPGCVRVSRDGHLWVLPESLWVFQPRQAYLLMGEVQHRSLAAALMPLLFLLLLGSPRQAPAPTGPPGSAGLPWGWCLPPLAAPSG